MPSCQYLLSVLLRNSELLSFLSLFPLLLFVTKSKDSYLMWGWSWSSVVIAGYRGYAARNIRVISFGPQLFPGPEDLQIMLLLTEEFRGKVELYTLRPFRERVDKHLFSVSRIPAYRRILHMQWLTTGVCSRTPSHWCSFGSEFCTFQTREQQTPSRSTQFAKKQKQKQYLQKVNMQGENLKEEKEDTLPVGGENDAPSPHCPSRQGLIFILISITWWYDGWDHPRKCPSVCHWNWTLDIKCSLTRVHWCLPLTFSVCCYVTSPCWACAGSSQPLIPLHPPFLPHICPPFLSSSFHPIHPSSFLPSFPPFMCQPHAHSSHPFFPSPAPILSQDFPFIFYFPLLP